MKTRVRAIIIQGGSILLIHRKKPDRDYYVFPGGGLEESDASPEAGLERECVEEVGIQVKVGAPFAEEPHNDQLEKFFVCDIVGGQVGTGTGPEFTRDPNVSGTYALEWIPVGTLPGLNVQPTRIRDLVATANW